MAGESKHGNWAKILTSIGIAVAAVNMAFGWYILLSSTGGNINLVDASAEQIEAVVALQSVESQYRISVGVVGFALTVLNIGFALFVMGIDAAVSISGEAGDMGGVALKTTSPGVVCIVFAVGLAGYVLFSHQL